MHACMIHKVSISGVSTLSMGSKLGFNLGFPLSVDIFFNYSPKVEALFNTMKPFKEVTRDQLLVSGKVKLTTFFFNKIEPNASSAERQASDSVLSGMWIL